MTNLLWRPAARRFIVAAILVAGIVLSLPIALTPGIRSRLTDALGERFESDVELASLHVSVLPRLRVVGSGIVLRHKGRTDVPPLITIASFTAEANLWGLIGRPVRLRHVRVDGLEINVPPGGVDLDKDQNKDNDKNARSETPPPQSPPRNEGEGNAGRSPLIVDGLVSERAVFRIIRRDPGKAPRVWEIAQLSMQGAGSNEPWPFRARLTNPVPPGELDVDGTFGPWSAKEPSDTPLGATYEFRDADLGVFKGIRGVLRSTGSFKGVLKRIEVAGTTDVPKFALDDVGQAVPLKTQFTAIVDGTNGNTWLKPVNAQLGGSSLIAQGGIVEREEEDGRTIELDVVLTNARIEDVLRLAVKSSEPALVGGLELKTKFLLPPGKVDVIEKLQLDGSFAIASAQFPAGGLQAKVNELSKKAQGDAGSGKSADRVASDFTGRFVMKGGVIRFSSLGFSVPGARLNLAGTYAIRSEALDFRGTVRMDAKVSELTTGFKSFLLKAVDPLLRRKDVTVIPITVSGTAEKPKFGLDIRRTLQRR
jgi:hypothetical protein